ncbi:MAG: GAF domain-containing protein [Frankiaceae bacterium]|nr:GAF domain-containing protein [Frankiaceae bacterium]
MTVQDAGSAADPAVPQRRAMPLADDVAAVSMARRFAVELIRSWQLPDLADDAALAVSELVSNAVLHGVPPLELAVAPIPGGVRVEAHDGSRLSPVRPFATMDTMTGRGIALVEAISARWGVDQLPDGKSVWCELAPRAELDSQDDLDVDSVLAAWADDADHEPTYTVALGDVPTELLISAKAHVDNLVREFALASAGEASGHTATVPEDLARMIDTVVHRFAAARYAVKRQAIAAANRGDERTDLTVTLSLSAVEAGENYLAALDVADAYARDARLLTLETPPQHRVFRQWYVGALVDQVRRAASGGSAERPPTFEQRLLDELGTVAAAQRASARAARLQAVTARLASAATEEDVAEVVLSAGLAVLGAAGGGLLLAQPDGSLSVPGAIGYPIGLVTLLRSEPSDADLPAARAIRTGEAVWVESRQARDEHFPGLAELEPQTMAVCAVPLSGTGRVLGALRFSFDTAQLFDADERAFIAALAAQTAQALERTMLYEGERQARAQAEDIAQRLARLQQVTAALSGAADAREISDIVISHAGDAVGAELTSFCLLVDDDTLEVVGSHGLGAVAAERWHTFPVAAQLPASEAVRTNAPVIVASLEEMERRFPLLAGQTSADRSLVCVPVSLGARRLGVFSLSFPRPHEFDQTGLRFLSALADTCAQAVDRARALEKSRIATDRLAFLAHASAELGRTLDVRETLSTLARLVVPGLADWASVDILEDGEVKAVAVMHSDPERIAFAQRLREHYPADPDASAGVPHVIRAGVSELYTTVSDERLASSAVDDEHLQLLRSLHIRSGLVVPLTGRAGTFGALTLIGAESGRVYDAADLSFAEDLAARAAVAVENAQAYSHQSGQLAAITRVAEAAQHAILAPMPERLGPVSLAAAYVSAARDALVGGDLYEAVEREGAVRILIGDVRGKGLEAVRMATVVLGHFRSAAVDCADLGMLARRVDDRLRPYLGDEDFVTAVMAEITPDGLCSIVTCGHPPAMLADGVVIRPVGAADSLPLGLGADPQPVTVQLQPGARLLLYTDGILEARDPAGAFVPLDDVIGPLGDGGPIAGVLSRILGELRVIVGGSLGDDLALVVAEYPAS